MFITSLENPVRIDDRSIWWKYERLRSNDLKCHALHLSLHVISPFTESRALSPADDDEAQDSLEHSSSLQQERRRLQPLEELLLVSLHRDLEHAVVAVLRLLREGSPLADCRSGTRRGWRDR